MLGASAATSSPTETGRAADRALCARLRAGDDGAFAAFAREQHPVLVRFASSRLGRGSPLVEEVVQEAWVVFLESLERYEGRSSLRTFLVGIVLNVLRNRARAEARTTPLSALDDAGEGGATVAAERFAGEGHPWAGHWLAGPRAWREDPAARRELREALEQEIAALPAAQRDVLTLRDVLGFDGEETCNALGLGDTHQRVLLHRARARLRAALERRLGEVA